MLAFAEPSSRFDSRVQRRPARPFRRGAARPTIAGRMDSEPRTDAPAVRALIERAAAGDAAALAELVEHHLDELRSFVRARSATLPLRWESSSDIVQSVCREVLSSADAFRYPEQNGFRRWLFKTAERKIGHRRDYYGAEKRDVRRDAAHEDLGALRAESPSPSREVIAREEMERVERAFLELPEHYRDVIYQARVLGRSREEIGRESGRAPAAVGNLLFRALAALAEKLEPSDGSPGA
jgi:RNA polymerase sigma factor (sigma-70 family)